ncbi:hypothetical protein THUN1379_31710 [Paludibacterium sp. THUN1379]|nr:hypothetical protein THUN1379_31710 [Paludibacterium sp. THUN1379]
MQGGLTAAAATRGMLMLVLMPMLMLVLMPMLMLVLMLVLLLRLAGMSLATAALLPENRLAHHAILAVHYCCSEFHTLKLL